MGADVVSDKISRRIVFIEGRFPVAYIYIYIVIVCGKLVGGRERRARDDLTILT